MVSQRVVWRSAGAVELRNALTGAFAVELPPTIAIDYPTIAALAAFISSKASASAPQQPAPVDFSPQHREPAPVAVSRDSIRLAVSAAVADILGATAAVDSGQPLMEAGLDSLGSVELRNALQSRFGVQLPATAVIDYPSVEALTAFVATLVTPAAGAVSMVAGALNARCFNFPNMIQGTPQVSRGLHLWAAHPTLSPCSTALPAHEAYSDKSDLGCLLVQMTLP